MQLDRPKVLDIIPFAIPTAGGGIVSVSGTNFGCRPSRVLGRLSNSNLTLCSWMSDSQVLCSTPPGIGAKHELVLSVPAASMSHVSTMSYSRPLINNIIPGIGDAASDKDFQITLYSGNLYLWPHGIKVNF